MILRRVSVISPTPYPPRNSEVNVDPLCVDSEGLCPFKDVSENVVFLDVHIVLSKLVELFLFT